MCEDSGATFVAASDEPDLHVTASGLVVSPDHRRAALSIDNPLLADRRTDANRRDRNRRTTAGSRSLLRFTDVLERLLCPLNPWMERV